MSIDCERSAAAKAQTALSTLTTSTLHTDDIVHRLRHATSFAAAASFSSDKALNDKRGEAGTALNGVADSLHRGQPPLTQVMIDRAKSAVAAWLLALDAA